MTANYPADAFDTCSISLSRPTNFENNSSWSPAFLERLYVSTSIPSLETRRRIGEIRVLPQGWAGPGSIAIDTTVLQRAISALVLIARVKSLPDPEITPNSNGTVSFEWENGRISLYLEIGKTTARGFLYGLNTGALPLEFSDSSLKSINLYEGFSEILNPTSSTTLSSDCADLCYA